MKAFVKGAALLLGVGLLSTHAQAQKVIIKDEEPNSILFISRDKAGDEIIRILNETQNQRFHEPGIPRFLLTDRKGRFALGIGGYVKATAEYDFGGISKDIDFYPALIPNKGASHVRNQFQMDATTSTVFLKLVGHTKHLGDFVVYTAGNFRGNGKGFELRNAYASLLGFTLGYDYGSFMDLAAIPPTIDFAGPNGMAIYHATQFRYERSFGKGWKAGVGVEMPVVDGLTNDNLVANKAESETGWGVLLSTTFNLCSKVQVYGQGVYGRGISQYMNDLSNLNVDIVPDPDKAGRMQVLPMMGWYAGLQYNITPNVFVSSTYSQSRLYSENDYPSTPSEQYRYGQYLVANLFWNITPDLQVGAEYLRGWRTDFNDQTRHANRLNLAVQYSF